MKLTVQKSSYDDIQFLRKLYLQENNFQIRYDSCHWRGWADEYLLLADEKILGYASVKGKEELADRDAIFEFYVMIPFRKYANSFFSKLIEASDAIFTECQTNDFLTTSMVYEFSKNIHSEVILFEDFKTTNFEMPELIFRKTKPEDRQFAKPNQELGDFVLEKNKNVIATGGFLLHYNPPFADVFMEVEKDHWGKGYGSFLVQEVKRECYLAGRVPSARCNILNLASKATLLKAGFKIAGYMLQGKLK